MSNAASKSEGIITASTQIDSNFRNLIPVQHDPVVAIDLLVAIFAHEPWCVI